MILVGGTLLILGSPAAKQVFRAEETWWPRWAMFSGMALKQMEVRIEARKPGEPLTLIDRYEALGYASRFDAPSYVRRVSSEADARRLARELCKKLGPNAELRMRLRQATRDGFRVVDPGERDACTVGIAGRR